MLLVGMVASALVFGEVLAEFSQLRLIKLIQGAAVVTMLLNIIALWKQEARNPSLTSPDRAATDIQRILAEVPHRRALEPGADCRWLRLRRLRHAGHSA